MASPVTPVTAGPPFDASLDPNATLLLAHGVLSVIAFAVCIPLSFFFSRYFRTTELFQGHYWIATFGSAGLALVAFVLAFVYHNASQTAHFASAHSYFGLAVLFWLFVQQVSGAVLHYFYDERKEEYRDGRTAGIWVHVVSGFLCLCGGVASCGVGIWQWGNWWVNPVRGRMNARVGSLEDARSVWLPWSAYLATWLARLSLAHMLTFRVCHLCRNRFILPRNPLTLASHSFARELAGTNPTPN